MARLLFVIVIIFQCNLLLAVQPLPEGVPDEPEEPAEEEFIPKEEPPPPEILEAIEKERQMKEEVIQREMELSTKEAKKMQKKCLSKKPFSMPKPVPQGPSLSIIITALAILLISFFIYRG